ncbi:hypothetical protein F5Y14DRAFT_269227 [Nemania sp. NC0429]|nr:hypothetical protein F5Y14DRAFT_269227 [Nemania sp. NC0429]
MSMAPVALYGLEVPPLGVMVPAMQEDSMPGACYRITMAALDPSEPPEADEDGNLPSVPRSTLKLIRKRASLDDELDDDYLQQLMNGEADEDSDEDDDDDEPNGGPSDKAKSKKAKAEALLKLIAAAEAEDSDEEMVNGDAKPNGKAAKKGKEPATSSDDDDDDESISSSDMEIEELVICTLDTERNYQQPLDITIGPEEQVFFVVKGTHAVHLTGNYIVDLNEADESDEEDDDDYELPEGIDGIDEYDSDSEADELDDIQDPRITEVDSDEEEKAAPKPVEPKKGKNKRVAEEEPESLDDMIAKADAVEQTKLSKKQQKKLKNNKGDAVAKDEAKAEATKESSAKGDKKVQFAKNLEQGPTGPAAAAEKGSTLGVKVVGGVTIDDRKLGSGRSVKKGNRVEVRYIGKLTDGKVFDSNKKGKPFSFKAGSGEVIKGWDVGIQGMSVGGERRLTIPAHLAYGSKAQPGIPANSQLTFDIKLLGIK